MKNNNTEEEKNEKTKRFIIYIIIIIIIVLALLTSCSCTSKFFGKIGNIYDNEGNFNIDDNINDKEKIVNQNLKFDSDKLDISLSETLTKLGFTYENIYPTEFTCSTNNADIATCYVSNGYVVINPKEAGEVEVILQTTANGKIYEATATITITDTERYIALSSELGTLNIMYGKTKAITYKLVGLTGDITVKSSDESIATATAKDGILRITAKKVGTVTFTLSINYNGKIYEKAYTLNVVRFANTTPPTNPTTPDDNSQGNNNKNHNSDVTLKTLNVNGMSILEIYYAEVNSNTINLKAVPNASTSVIVYNGKEYSSLDNIPINLNTGINTIRFKVRAEDGTTLDYIVNINRTSSSSGGSSGGSNPTERFTLKLENEYICYIEDKTCDITYKVVDSNGNTVGSEKYGNINVSIPGFSGKYAKVVDGILRLSYNNMTEAEYQLTMTSSQHGAATSTIKFVSNSGYTLKPVITPNENGEYVKDISLTSQQDNDNIIIYTDIFKNTTISSPIISEKNENDGKLVLKVCAQNNNNICIYFETTDTNLISKMEYRPTSSESSPSYLPITIYGNDKDGTATITLRGEVGDKIIQSTTIKVNFTTMYILSVNANGGQFNSTDDISKHIIYEYLVSKKSSTINLKATIIPEPYKLTDDGCYYYKLIGYSKTSTGTTLNNIYTLDKDLYLWAIYSQEKYNEDLEDKNVKTVWIYDTGLFNNYKDTAEDGGESKLELPYYANEGTIYPGASGSYTANYTNNTGKDIIVKGMILKENETICFDYGCINMAYIVRTDDKDDYYYYFGKKPATGFTRFTDDNYTILNQNNKPGYRDVDFSSKPIVIKNGEKASLNIHWRWVEKNDDLDTAIGEYAYANPKKNNYSIAIGVKYYLDNNDKCN